MSRTGREFSAELEREAVALLESGGRPLTRVAGEAANSHPRRTASNSLP